MRLALVRHLWGEDHADGLEHYRHTLPCTQTPVADLADICDWQARRQAGRFARLLGAPNA